MTSSTRFYEQSENFPRWLDRSTMRLPWTCPECGITLTASSPMRLFSQVCPKILERDLAVVPSGVDDRVFADFRHFCMLLDEQDARQALDSDSD